jgi:N,N'-diacetyllegionaminate synthase
MNTSLILDVGVNHNGSISRAIKLIDAIAEVANPKIMAKFQVWSNGRFPNLSHLSFRYAEFEELFQYCESRGVQWCATPFDMKAIDFLASLHMPIWKIASGFITNYSFIEKVNSVAEDIVLSTGMATIDEINKAMLHLDGLKVSLLHCVSEYPAPISSLNLRSISYLKDNYNVPVGYSDHSGNPKVLHYAVIAGADMLECHITESRSLDGPDHRASLEVCELKQTLQEIAFAETLCGDTKKAPTYCEYYKRDKIRSLMNEIL